MLKRGDNFPSLPARLFIVAEIYYSIVRIHMSLVAMEVDCTNSRKATIRDEEKWM